MDPFRFHQRQHPFSFRNQIYDFQVGVRVREAGLHLYLVHASFGVGSDIVRSFYLQYLPPNSVGHLETCFGCRSGYSLCDDRGSQVLDGCFYRLADQEKVQYCQTHQMKHHQA